MTVQTQYEGMEVIEAGTLLKVPHLKGELTFVYPIKAGNYKRIREQIKESQLHGPTTAETISLLYDAFKNKGEEYAQEILKILKEKYFLCFTENLWVSKGVYVVDNNDGNSLNESDLEKRLHADDKDVRFVPYGFKRGEQSIPEFEKHPLTIAHAGKEGAQKLAEIAMYFHDFPVIVGFENDMAITCRSVTGLDSCFFGRRLFLDTLVTLGNPSGYSLGIQR